MTNDEHEDDSQQALGLSNAEREALPEGSSGPAILRSPDAVAHSEVSASPSGDNGPHLTEHEVSREALRPAVTSTLDFGDFIIKPANDDMSYRHLVLPNGIRVLLISDPATDKAGAAMDVRAGSLSDPDTLPGLAHFTEHMLFYSSKKYPVEDEYTKFISDRGGVTNAYTAAEHTNYHFNVNWESLEGALDRFAQFFIAPTISRDGIEREVKAVDSEHGKNLQSDAWRKSQVNKATADPGHPWARFSTGNYDTLYTRPLAAGIDPRDAVVDFYDRHYSADRCALAVLGRQPVNELEDMVRSMFSQVPNKQLPWPDIGDDVFRGDQIGVLIKMVPVREGQSLELVWQVPPSESLYREQPLGYLSHLLGHEGEGSVFALLKAAGWASALWAGESGGALSFASFFTIHVDLTEEGQRNIKEVATAVFRYLALLNRPEGVCERIWEEVRGLAQLHFDTRDRSQPLTYCTTLSSALQLYPPQDLLLAVYAVPREFSVACIRTALSQLTPERVRAFWISKVHNRVGGGGGGIGGGDVTTKAASHAEMAASPATPLDAAAREEAAAVAGAESVVVVAGTQQQEQQQQQQQAQPAAAEETTGLAVMTAVGDTTVGGVRNNAASAAAGGPTQEVGRGKTEEEGLLTEPVYGTRYGISPLPVDWLTAWAEARAEDEPRLHLPAPNRFIPTDLSLADDEAAASEDVPTVTVAVPGRLRLWHKPDTRFRQPKAVLYIDVLTPEAYCSPRAAVMTRMFTRLMLDYLNEVAYPAQQAGLDYNLLNTQSGWQLLLSGYNHKLPELLAEVLERLADFKVLPDRFEFVREGLVREYANQLHNQPYSWAMYRAEMLTTARRWPIELYGCEAAAVTAAELGEFVRRLCGRCFIEGLVVGNMRRQEVLHCAALLLGCIWGRCGAVPLHPAEMPELRMLEIPPTPRKAPVPQSPAPQQQQQQKQLLHSVGLLPPPPAAVEVEMWAAARKPVVESIELVAASGGDAGVAAVESAAGLPASRAAVDEPAGQTCDGAAGSFSDANGEPAATTGSGSAYQAVSGGWLFVEDVPNSQDENSAALVMYQVGPDDLRRNALRSLLVHLAKRDAFTELRTRQQLGYIVSLHGGSEHGVGYVEMLVQSNVYDADELCQRLDSFMQWFLDTGLPVKCGLTHGTSGAVPAINQQPSGLCSGSGSGGSVVDVAVAMAAGESPQPMQQRTTNSNVADGDGACSGQPMQGSRRTGPGTPGLNLTEFEIAVEELAKSKLEKPKKLGDLANRWWSEVHHGCYCFDRQVAEVAQMRSITPVELQTFASELLTGAVTPLTRTAATTMVSCCREARQGAPSRPEINETEGSSYRCRRLSVQIRGKAEVARVAAAQLQLLERQRQPVATAPGGWGEEHEPCGALSFKRRHPYSHIPSRDPFSWKEGCSVLPTVRAIWAAKRAASGKAPLLVSAAEEEVERI